MGISGSDHSSQLVSNRWRSTRRFALTVALVAGCLSLTSATAEASSSTIASVNFVESDGSTPMANASVDVFYWPADTPDTGTLTRIGSGTTDGNGNASIYLDTSAVTDPGYSGGPTADTFDIVIFAFDPGGNLAIDFTAVTEGSTTTASTSANLTYTPGSTDSVGGSGGTFTTPTGVTVNRHVWVAAGAENVADGMEGDFTEAEYYRSTYSWTEEGGSEIGPFYVVKSMFLEEQDHGVSATSHVSQSFHFVNYLQENYHLTEVADCNPRGCGEGYAWLPQYFVGPVTCQDVAQGGCGPVNAYTPPPFDSAHSFPLQPGVTERRTSVETKIWSVGATLLNLNLDTEAAYTQATRASWGDTGTGCPNGTRYLWGSGADWAVAPIAQASCVS